jgi:hypothetical protein
VADITRTRSVTEQTDTLGARGPKTRTTTTERVVVRSPRCDRLDVSALRDLVRALDRAGAPDQTPVTGHRSDVGHLVQLTAEWTTVEPTTTEEASVERS